MEKNIFTDERGRKVKTEHRTEDGTLAYVNEYFYEGKDKIPVSGFQTHYHDNGKVAIERDAVYSKAIKAMVFTRERIFDETGDITQEICFDKKTGEKTKEKIFKRNKSGYLFAHRRTFEADGSTPKTDDICIALAGSLISINDSALKDFVSKLDNPFKKEIDQKARFFAQAKTR